MAKLILGIEDVLLSQVLMEAVNRGQTIDAFVADALRLALEKRVTPVVGIDIEAVLRKLIERAINKSKGEQFYLDELCKPDEWNAINAGGRKSLGKEFRKAVENPAHPIAKHAGRTTGNKAIYVRI